MTTFLLELMKVAHEHPEVRQYVVPMVREASEKMPVSRLPGVLPKVLPRLGFRSPVVFVTFSLKFDWGYAGGKGKQGRGFLLDVDSGKVLESHEGSWGGSNPFSSGNVVDEGKVETLRPGQAHFLFSGNYGSLTLHPEFRGLTQGERPKISPAVEHALYLLGSLNSRGRRDAFESNGWVLDPRVDPLKSLISAGLVRQVGRGIRLTEDGVAFNAKPQSGFHRF